MREPVRMCVACRGRYPKERLLRFVEKNGALFFDPLYKAPGRGVNVCPSPDCLKKAVKRGLFERGLKTSLKQLPDFEALREMVLRDLETVIVNHVRMGLKFKGVVLGREALFRNLERVELVLLARDLSENSLKELEGRGVKGIFFGTKQFWGDVLNRRPVGIIGIVDRGLARKVEGFLFKYRALKGEVELDGQQAQN